MFQSLCIMRNIAVLFLLGAAVFAFSACGNSTNSPGTPEITSIKPLMGSPGTTVTINGSGFSKTASENRVIFNDGVVSEVQKATDSSLVTSVPVGARSGPIEVEVAEKITQTPTFTVLSSTGTVEVMAATTGEDLDTDGYRITLKSTGEQRALDTQGTIRFQEIPEGTHELEITEVAGNCALEGDNPRIITVSGGKTTTDTISVVCNRISKIAFSSTRTGDSEIWKMNSNGENPVNLTNNPGSDSRPFWSPNGKKIGFLSYRTGEGNIEIWIMNPDGTEQRQLTNNPSGEVFAPNWSPDGSKIAFSNNRSGNFEIRVIDADGNNPKKLTTNAAFDSEPRWSPDGSKIIFVSERTGNSDIWIMDIDGSDKAQLTHNAAFDGKPTWSPNGSKIVFESERSGNRDIWIMNVDGSEQTNLSDAPGIDHFPRWSPDGTKITFRSDRTGNFEIWVMDAGGANPTNLTNNPATDVGARWSPDGTKIAFESDRTGNFQIFVMNTDGTNLIQLTSSPEGNLNQRWQPQP